ncbi:MAG: ATP-dependent Clp protease proteolytic subunit [Planctomycetes bacterium]|nr:ATP-dependent Clp protease proteolytic subunit [Planctomycetota bacterium]
MTEDGKGTTRRLRRSKPPRGAALAKRREHEALKQASRAPEVAKKPASIVPEVAPPPPAPAPKKPASVVRRPEAPGAPPTAGITRALPPAPVAPDEATVPAAHLAALRPADALAPPVNENTTVRTKREEPKHRQSKMPSAPGTPHFSGTRGIPPPSAPGSPGARMHESRGMPASAAPPPAAPKPPPAPPVARPDQASGTLAGFVSATRQLFKKFSGAPPEVRITLPTNELSLFKITGLIDDRVALQAATWILFVQAMKSDADLTLAIDSTGGSITAGLSLIDVMLKAKCRVRTHCPRQAQGISSIVLAAGSRGYRTIGRSALITVPGAPGVGDGKTAALLAPRVVAAVAAATGRPAAQVEKDLLKLKAVTPKLAVKHGLADAVAV